MATDTLNNSLMIRQEKWNRTEVLSRYTNIRINKLIQHERRVELNDYLRISRSRVIENITSFHILWICYIVACNRCQTDILNTQIHIPTKRDGKVHKMFVFMTMIDLLITSSTFGHQYLCRSFLMKAMCDLAKFSLNTSSYFSNHYDWLFMLVCQLNTNWFSTKHIRVLLSSHQNVIFSLHDIHVAGNLFTWH